jgi:ubiquinone/menaquinone biosynthesis C-methylase UbiE
MDARLQRRVQRYGWDKAAEFYEPFWAHQLAPAQNRMLVLAALAPGERVLDVACGTGLVTRPAAAPVGPSGAVVGTDIADEMVLRLRETSAARGLTQITAERMDAENLTFVDNAFDVVVCGLGLMYVPDPRRPLEQMRRVLRPGGRVAVAVWGPRSNCGWADIFPDHGATGSVGGVPAVLPAGPGRRTRSHDGGRGDGGHRRGAYHDHARVRVGS